MTTVAILGANGFIGSRLVEMFILNNHAEVRPIVRTFQSLAPLSRFALDCRVALASDQQALQSAFAGCDVVVHAISGPPEVITGTLEAPYLAAEAAGVRRFIYLSSASVHGQAPAPGTDENSPLNGQQKLAYNNAKIKAESKLRELRSRGNVEVVILRPGIVYGPRSSWVTSFADALLQGNAYLVNQGRGVCNSLYVDHLVEAILHAMSTPAADGHAFLLRDQESITWADLYRPIANALGYDLNNLPEAEVPTSNGWKEGVRRIHKSKPVQAALSVFPGKIRQAAYDALISTLTPTTSPWALPPRQTLVATEEMAQLYQCEYALPFDKAKAILRYQPTIPFQEACCRTISWLAFAGYPVCQTWHNNANRERR